MLSPKRNLKENPYSDSEKGLLVDYACAFARLDIAMNNLDKADKHIRGRMISATRCAMDDILMAVGRLGCDKEYFNNMVGLLVTEILCEEDKQA
jgi:hypothetical protein